MNKSQSILLIAIVLSISYLNASPLTTSLKLKQTVTYKVGASSQSPVSLGFSNLINSNQFSIYGFININNWIVKEIPIFRLTQDETNPAISDRDVIKVTAQDNSLIFYTYHDNYYDEHAYIGRITYNQQDFYENLFLYIGFSQTQIFISLTGPNTNVQLSYTQLSHVQPLSYNALFEGINISSTEIIVLTSFTINWGNNAFTTTNYNSFKNQISSDLPSQIFLQTTGGFYGQETESKTASPYNKLFTYPDLLNSYQYSMEINFRINEWVYSEIPIFTIQVNYDDPSAQSQNIIKITAQDNSLVFYTYNADWKQSDVYVGRLTYDTRDFNSCLYLYYGIDIKNNKIFARLVAPNTNQVLRYNQNLSLVKGVSHQVKLSGQSYAPTTVVKSFYPYIYFGNGAYVETVYPSYLCFDRANDY